MTQGFSACWDSRGPKGVGVGVGVGEVTGCGSGDGDGSGDSGGGGGGGGGGEDGGGGAGGVGCVPANGDVSGMTSGMRERWERNMTRALGGMSTRIINLKINCPVAQIEHASVHKVHSQPFQSPPDYPIVVWNTRRITIFVCRRNIQTSES